MAKKLKTLIFQCNPKQSKCIRLLIERERIEVVKIGSDDPDSIDSFSYSDYSQYFSPAWLVDNLSPVESAEAIREYPEFYRKHFAAFSSYFTRLISMTGTLRYDQLARLFCLYYHHAFHILHDNEIELLILPDIPHAGFDLFLYTIAKEKGLKIMIVQASCFPNKTFLLSDSLQYGNHEECPLLYHDEKPTLEWGTPFYMERILKQQIKQKGGGRFLPVSIRQWAYMPRFLFLTLSQIAHRGRKSSKIIRQTNPETSRRPGILSRQIGRLFKVAEFELSLSLKRAKLAALLARDAEIEVDTQRKFVYFPLHVQPEMTTSVLGDVYEDQVYAVECLATLLPDDWKIYVKEHPFQVTQDTPAGLPDYFRDENLFFKRLKNHPKVVLIANSVDSKMLTYYCQFMATITGTAGWEALLNGKPVLVFGEAWYKRFSGAIRYTPDTTLEEILSTKICREELARSLAALYNRMATGVFHAFHDENIVEGVPDFDPEKNALSLAEAMEKFIDFLIEKDSPPITASLSDVA